MRLGVAGWKVGKVLSVVHMADSTDIERITVKEKGWSTFATAIPLDNIDGRALVAPFRSRTYPSADAVHIQLDQLVDVSWKNNGMHREEATNREIFTRTHTKANGVCVVSKITRSTRGPWISCV